MLFRDILMAAATQGDGPAPPADPYGPELVTNGDFSSAAGWTFSGDVLPTISGGKLRGDEMPDGGNAIQSVATSVGTYHAVFTIDSITDGGVSIVVGGGPGGVGASRTAPGTYAEDLVSDGTDEIAIIMSTEGSIVIDNVSVKLVL